MAEYNLSIIADADDGHETGGTLWVDRADEGYSSGEFFTIRRDDGAPETASLGALRFQNLPVSQGATITSATLTVEIAAIGGNDPTTAILTVTGDDVDDAAALGDTHRPSSGWTDTTAVANANGLAAGPLQIDVTSIVQEIVSRVGWQSGNSIAFKLTPTGDDTYWAVNIADYDADTTATVATLDVITADSGSSTVAPTTGLVSMQGRIPLVNDFSIISLRGTLVNEAGSPVSDATGINCLVWYNDAPSGAPDESLSSLTTNSNGSYSFALATGGLVFGQAVYRVIYQGDPPARNHSGRRVPDYE